MFQLGVDAVYEECWRHAGGLKARSASSVHARYARRCRAETRPKLWPCNVAVRQPAASRVYVQAKWSDGLVSCYSVALPAPGSMDIYIFCAWLEAEVKKQAALDPFTQVRFTSDRELLSIACTQAVEGNLVIQASVLAGKTERMRGALEAGKKRSRWAARVAFVSGASSCCFLADPTIAAVRIVDADHLPHLLVKVAPGKNSSAVMGDCAWLAIEPHPFILPVVLMLGPNLFVIPGSSLASTNAAHWLHRNARVSNLTAARRRRLVCSMLLQVAEAVQHIHNEGALHLDLKPDNVAVAEHPTACGPLECQIRCQLCDWELISTFEGAAAKDCSGTVSSPNFCGGTPPFWSPEQVVPLPRSSTVKGARLLAAHAFESVAVDAFWRDACLDAPPLPPAPRQVKSPTNSKKSPVNDPY